MEKMAENGPARGLARARRRGRFRSLCLGRILAAASVDRPRFGPSTVMRGLDPRVHDELPLSKPSEFPASRRIMDCRVKPGNDNAPYRKIFSKKEKGFFASRR